jgi:D-glycero-alpha-D-manno-heptose-7-phosphate kinase
MIIVRSPLRISFGGGGTDLPYYFTKNEGFVLSAAINKYIYISLITPFIKKIILKYSSSEYCDHYSEIRHPIFREVLTHFKTYPKLEISSSTDIPSGTGLGSSGSFTCALIKAISLYLGKKFNKEEIAKLSCHIEIDVLKQTVGKQDQYISSYGGIRSFKFHKDGKVTNKLANINKKTISHLENKLMLFYTGITRRAPDILKYDNSFSDRERKKIFENLDETKNIGYKILKLLEEGKINDFGELMNVHWNQKKKRSKKISNIQIDEYYKIGLKNGAIGGKLVGAGGGGFLMFLAKDKEKLKNAMSKNNLKETSFKFDFEGVKTIFK